MATAAADETSIVLMTTREGNSDASACARHSFAARGGWRAADGAPREKSRGRVDFPRAAPRSAARQPVSGALGLAAVLLVSGIIEAFVTPSPLPTWARIAIGFLAWGAFMAYVFTVGRWAVRRGNSGDVSARDAGDMTPVVG